MVSLCGLCRAVAPRYPEIDADLLLSGAVLHDIGKVQELSYERSINYTTEGVLLGHLIIEIALVTKRMDAIEGFPPPLRTLIQHLLISHHGRYEFGSPRLPLFRRAGMLEQLHELGSKIVALTAP